MPKNTEIRQTVIAIVRDVMEINDARSDDELAELLTEDLAEHLDSIKLFSMIVAIEDHFKICLEPDDDAAIHSLDDVVNTVARLVTQAD